MAIKYNGENALTYLLSLLSQKFGTKVDKIDGKGLSTNDYTTAEKAKLSGIEQNANNYTHPNHTAKTSGLYKITVDDKGHVSGASAVSKSDITGLGIPAQDTTYSVATQSANGLMSSSDKSKLDGMNATINAAIAAAPHLKRAIVSELPAAASADSNTIYMVPVAGVTGDNKYTEWMVIEGAWEKTGSTDVDLSGYVKTVDMVEFSNSEVQSLWDNAFSA